MTTSSKRLGELLQGVTPVADAWSEIAVTWLTDDSRQVGPGAVFFAVTGLHVDGHNFAERAVSAGAAAVVAERPLPVAVPTVVVTDSARALAVAAARLYGPPAGTLRLLGITGTNGKTTTTYVIESILRAAGRQAGVVGTVAYRYAGQTEQAPFTTPTPILLHQLFGRMGAAGCTDVVMEVSSHALELGRLHGCSFEVGAFTHLTQDHLDLHGSMEAYLAAKLLLFQRYVRAGGAACVNVDGSGADAVVAAVRARGVLMLWRCSSQGREAEVSAREATHSIDGFSFELAAAGVSVVVRSPLLGAFNLDNVLMASTCALAAGIAPRAIVDGVAQVSGVPGRLERVDGGEEFAVLVDYAHTPDALERAIAVLRPLCRGRLLTVFGCGGDRDRTKRPLMGGVVAQGADLAVVTSDNPRTEDPHEIIAQILAGVRTSGRPEIAELGGASVGYHVQPDRRQAIFAAVRAAQPGDVVLIAGKGHEDYQILGTTRIHFDDREQAREALKSR